MFERFDKETKGVLVGAPAEAAAAGSRTIEAEHLLLSMAAASSTEAGRLLRRHQVTRAGLLAALVDPRGGFDQADVEALSSVGVDLAAIQNAADDLFGAGSFAQAGVRPARGAARFGESAKTALALSLQESLSSKSRRISTLHLLLGLIRDPSGACTRLLAPFGLDYDAIRKSVDEAA